MGNEVNIVATYVDMCATAATVCRTHAIPGCSLVDADVSSKLEHAGVVQMSKRWGIQVQISQNNNGTSRLE